MRTGIVIAAIAAVAAIGFGIYMIDVDQTEQATIPDVDVSIEGGNMPAFEADLGDIDLGTEEMTVSVLD